MRIHYQFQLGILFGLAICHFLWYIRLKKDYLLKEMILYLNEGDLSIFFGMGMTTLFLFLLASIITIIVLNRMKKK